mmetsp:Transcript_44381/g.116610  ORF Transcript_44381/g.116610 Transcript_44381/m.116610 type:complete len:117 (-) Transcript_44381:970-1320(-)
MGPKAAPPPCASDLSLMAVLMARERAMCTPVMITTRRCSPLVEIDGYSFALIHNHMPHTLMAPPSATPPSERATPSTMETLMRTAACITEWTASAPPAAPPIAAEWLWSRLVSAMQ